MLFNGWFSHQLACDFIREHKRRMGAKLIHLSNGDGLPMNHREKMLTAEVSPPLTPHPFLRSNVISERYNRNKLRPEQIHDE